MTPPARVQAAITVLDAVLRGTPAEQALTNWGRASRYAGSGDRAAVRDHVFSALRCRRSFAALGRADGTAAETGRALMLGGVRAADGDPAALFTGAAHAPALLDDAERGLTLRLADLPQTVALDCPDWLAPALRDSLGPDFGAVMEALRHRAPVFLRVNAARAKSAGVIAALAAQGIIARPHPLSPNALEIEGNPRNLTATEAFLGGMFELQDAASQAVAAMVPLSPGLRVLDYCAGGGGKALAFAAQAGVQVFAHDADPQRMRDLAPRAARAGVRITALATAAVAAAAPFDRVVLDVPCSGSGSWRRAPEAKWALTPARLAALHAVQAEILDQGSHLVAPQGLLAYATCSMLDTENSGQIDAFLARHPAWRRLTERGFTPTGGADGFYFALLGRV